MFPIRYDLKAAVNLKEAKIEIGMLILELHSYNYHRDRAARDTV
jgi:hypothetical protein